MSQRAERLTIVQPQFTNRRTTIGDIALLQTRETQEQLDELVRCIDFADSTTLLEMVADGRTHGRELVANFRAGELHHTIGETTPPAYQEVDSWYRSEIGQRAMARLTNACTTLISKTIAQGHPGHDRRHICLKDPLSALRFLVEDQISDWRQVFLIGALLHDVGRLPEPRIYGAPASGVAGENHAYLSFEILRRLLLEFPEVPQKLKDALLFSIVVHQSGKDQENFGAQFVQRADREQLVGAEFLARGIPAGVGFNNLSFAIPHSEVRSRELGLPGSPDETDIAHHIEFYLRNLYANIGSGAEKHAEEGKVISGIFLKLAHGVELEDQLFAPELTQKCIVAPSFGKFKKALRPETWATIAVGPSPEEREAMRAASDGRSLLELAEQLCSLPLAAKVRSAPSNALEPTNSPTIWERMEARLLSLTQLEQERWREAFAYAAVHVDKALLEDRRIMQGAHALFRDQPLSVGRCIANFVDRELTLASIRVL